jgi:hypothetical protein
VLSPEKQEPGVLEVAVFTDGAAYHVQSSAARARIQDDLKKRLGLSRAGKYLSWSITWRDVTEHETNTITDAIPPWWPDTEFRRQVGKLADALKLGGLLPVLDRDPVTGLLAHLNDPRKLPMLAALATFVLLHQRGKQVPAGQAGAAHDNAREAEVPSTSPAEPVPGGDDLLAKAVFGADGEGLFVVSAPREAFATLTSRPERARVTLRLDDRHERRKTPGFQTVWRQALRAWNLLQALPNAVIASSEQLADLAGATAAEATVGAKTASVAPPRRDPSMAPPSALSADVEGVLAEIRDARARDVVRAVVLRGAAAPAVPYETILELKGNAGDIEVGWASERVGAFLDEQSDAADRLRAQGWTLFPIEAGLTEAVLFQALRTEEA